jgi:hypothetical protein
LTKRKSSYGRGIVPSEALLTHVIVVAKWISERSNEKKFAPALPSEAKRRRLTLPFDVERAKHLRDLHHHEARCGKVNEKSKRSASVEGRELGSLRKRRSKFATRGHQHHLHRDRE